MQHCLVPVSAHDDLPYRDVANGVVLWRYLEGYKFEHLLSTRSLWFSRIDQFSDQEEAIKPDSAKNSTGEQKFFDANGLSGWGEQYPGASLEQRATRFGLCWHMNTRENSIMWAKYTPDCNDSVAIVTTVKSLKRGLRILGRVLRYSAVRYVARNDPRPQFDSDAIFFYKDRDRFSFENEYRILASLSPSESPFHLEHDCAKKRIVPFNTNVGIARIVFHPDASVRFRTEMRSRYRSVFPSVKAIEDSSL